MSNQEQRYVGRIGTVVDGYGFIAISTVKKVDGSPHEIETEKDIFIHQSNCAEDLEPGLLIEFGIEPDEKREEGHYAASGATTAPEQALLPPPTIEVLPGLTTRTGDQSQLPVIHTDAPSYLPMKPIPEEAVAQAAKNKPLEGVAPDGANGAEIMGTEEELLQAFEMYLRHLFPGLQSVINDFRVTDFDAEALDTQVNELASNYHRMEMEQQAVELEEMYAKFKVTRDLLGWIHEKRLFTPGSRMSPFILGSIVKLFEEIGNAREKVEIFEAAQATIGFLLDHEIMKPNSLIPVDKLPDFLCATPVWFWALGEDRGDEKKAAARSFGEDDPDVPAGVKYICDLFPGNARFAHAFQMWNRRLRPLSVYQGEIIPPLLMKVIGEAREIFDYVVIITPYHDVAGCDWQDLEWIRAIDPYVIGFKKGLPVLFVLGRFSDQGVYPHLNELVADTMQFLNANRDKLAGFNGTTSPYWLVPNTRGGYTTSFQRSSHDGLNLGDFLMRHVDRMQQAYQAGKLFDWLRGEWDIPTQELAEGETAEQLDGDGPAAEIGSGDAPQIEGGPKE